MDTEMSDSIESVMREGFEHLGHILTPLVKKRTVPDTNIQDENVSPRKYPKVLGLKDGCTVSRGSGRLKYIGSARRLHPLRTDENPLMKTLSEAPVRSVPLFKPIFQKSILATPSKCTKTSKSATELKDRPKIGTRLCVTKSDNGDDDTPEYEDLKNTQNTSQETVDSSMQDDSSADPSYTPTHSANVSSEYSSTANQSKTTEEADSDKDNGENSDYENEEDSDNDLSEHDEHVNNSDKKSSNNVSVKRSTVIIVDNLHKSSDMIDSTNSQDDMNKCSENRKKSSSLKSPQSRENRVKNYASTIGTKGVSYTISAPIKVPDLSKFMSPPKSDLAGYKQKAMTYSNQIDQPTISPIDDIDTEDPEINPLMELSEDKQSKNHTKQSLQMPSIKNEEAPNQQPELSEDELQADESEIPAAEDNKKNKKSTTNPLSDASLTSTPKNAVDKAEENNSVNNNSSKAADGTIENLEKSKPSNDGASESDNVQKETNQKASTIDPADETNAAPKNWDFIADCQFETILKGNF